MNERNGVQGKALILAGGLTAFALVVVLAVAAGLAGRAAEPATKPTAVARATAAPRAGPDQAVQALLDEREAAYRQVVQQANDRLAEANRRLAQAQSRPPGPAAAAPQPANIGADLAGQIALLVAPGSSLTKPPELVNFQGTAAYEVTLTNGVVYVDARSGRVLGSSIAAPVAQASSGGGNDDGNGALSPPNGDHENEDEGHEHEDHDEDEQDDRDEAEHEDPEGGEQRGAEGDD
jgi:hypothetical protein